MPDRSPRYPVYVISKGRYEKPLTARFLIRDRVPFTIVVEPQERDAYAAAVGAEHVAVLPFSNLGRGSIPARNWVWDDAIARGAERHWILDDNIREVYRYYRGERVRCVAGPAFAAVEDFVDRYENVAVAGLNYRFFLRIVGLPPFFLNAHVYSCLLIKNDLPFRWRGRYNEDTDLCLQVIAAGWCTVNVNAFTIDKAGTMTMKGGNSTELYKGDGRLRMARALERVWPRVASVSRRFRRPQHHVAHDWRRFDTPLRLKPGAVVPDGVDEYGLTLAALTPPKSPRVRALLQGAQSPTER